MHPPAPARSRHPAGSLAALLRDHAGRLAAAGVASPEQDAAVLAGHALGLARHELRTASAADVSPAALESLASLVARRAAREPLQLLTGATGFRTLTVRCRPGVFIPRPETELLAGLAIDRLRSRPDPVVAEPCTGTGAVALAVAAEIAGVVVATDTSPDAVALARENAARLGLAVDVRLGDLLAPLPAALVGRVDVVVANPPYLTPAEVAVAPPEVTGHDPAAALVGGGDGNAVVRRLLVEAVPWLRPGGWLLVEVGAQRAAALAADAAAADWCDVDVARDLTGRDRFLLARR